MCKKEHKDAMAFDFDGTLILNGKFNNDKGVHIMYSAWTACYATGFRRFLLKDSLENDVEKMVAAYIQYPGSPRFEQLSAIVNSLVNDNCNSVSSFDGFNIKNMVSDEYEKVRDLYNTTFSGINDMAAELYWKPFKSVKTLLKKWSLEYDLFIASGVTQDILDEDLIRHNFDTDLFKGVFGGNKSGGDDKGELLQKIKSRGYNKLLFLADSNKDLEYAKFADVNFFRIKSNDDYKRVAELLPENMPDEKDAWVFSDDELSFFNNMTLDLLSEYTNDNKMKYKEITEFINKKEI